MLWFSWSFVTTQTCDDTNVFLSQEFRKRGSGAKSVREKAEASYWMSKRVDLYSYSRFYRFYKNII